MRTGSWVRRRSVRAGIAVAAVAALAAGAVALGLDGSAPAARRTPTSAPTGTATSTPTDPGTGTESDIGTVSGTVTDSAGEPVAGLAVAVRSHPLEAVQGLPTAPPGPAWTATTDEAGRYAVPGVLAGAVRVQFGPVGAGGLAVEFNGDAPTVDLAPDLEVTAGEELQVDAELGDEARLEGTVRALPGTGPEGRRTVVAELRVGDTWVDVAQVAAGARGRYVLRRLPAGSYRVRAEGAASGRVHHPAAPTASRVDVVRVRAGDTVDGVDITMRGPGRLVGQALAADGTPLAGTWVNVYERAASTSKGSFVVGLRRVRADATGRFELALPARDYGIWVGAGAFPYLCSDTVRALVDRVTLTSGTTTVRDARARPTSTISGRVTDDAGRPIRGAAVRATPVASACEASATTGPDGRYRMRGVVAGRYDVWFSSDAGHLPQGLSVGRGERVLTVAPGRPVTGVDASLARGGRIVGRVSLVGEGSPAELVVYADSDPVPGEDVTYSAEARVGPDGRFELVALHPATYRLRFAGFDEGSVLTHYDGDGTTSTSAADAVGVEVPAGTTIRGLEALLDLSARVEGRVVDGDGAPRKDIQVVAYASDPATGEWEEVASAWTGGQGRYAVKGLPAGTYRIGFAGGEQFHPGAESVEDADDVILEPGETAAGLDAELVFEWD